ncbi:hypothetical protein Fmac_025020 [Flemingia macrophylla]|uniref:Saposin-like type B region 1 domain-containing protein n=1 Tax=Flemingia macrophylla TaxID=520843 RepID=A0ABD1LR13_9FABA
MLTYFPYANLSIKSESDVCVLCEEYAIGALDYVNDKENQKKINDTLHNTCGQLLSFKQQNHLQCVHIVDRIPQIRNHRSKSSADLEIYS